MIAANVCNWSLVEPGRLIILSKSIVLDPPLVQPSVSALSTLLSGYWERRRDVLSMLTLGYGTEHRSRGRGLDLSTSSRDIAMIYSQSVFGASI